jgi:ABC-type enterochelin transport system ATPase subunit
VEQADRPILHLVTVGSGLWVIRGHNPVGKTTRVSDGVFPTSQGDLPNNSVEFMSSKCQQVSLKSLHRKHLHSVSALKTQPLSLSTKLCGIFK